MSEDANFGFGKFVPGFDFLQNIAKGAAQSSPRMSTLSNWVAPTLNLEELDKRISELKAVHFWLDQNSKALSATIQALEVQKMTLATLKGMNFSMGELASALQVKTPDPAASAPSPAAGGNGQAEAGTGAASAPAGNATASIDPLQWWGSLTQQFQQIAASAIQETAQASDLAASSITPLAKPAVKKAAARKSPARKSRSR